MRKYEGKKILIVNIATGGKHANQLYAMEQFYQQHKDSIVVIAIPTDSFGNEGKRNESIDSVLQNSYHINFPVAARQEITGNNMHTLYKWLTSKTENGVMNSVVRDDFQKYLLNSKGELVGVFSSSTGILSDKIQQAIKNNH